MTSFLIAGGGGMLGVDLNRALEGRDVTSLTRSELDITDLAAVRAVTVGRDVIINAAAYTNVDGAETDETTARLINATGAGNLATAAAENGARLVQVSTDYVFDGTATTPYAEDFPRSPASAYGRTKAEGEELALGLNPTGTYVIRTAWLYGANGSNFARTMVKLGAERDKLTVVTDQVGQPTWSLDVAERIVAMIDADAPAGIYHATNDGEASWFDFARAIFTEVDWDPQRVLPTTSAQYIRAAPRPAYSVLAHRAWANAGLAPMRHWRQALSAAKLAGVLRPSVVGGHG
jgi:dTDP-4-dehydrorhamnose reductase